MGKRKKQDLATRLARLRAALRAYEVIVIGRDEPQPVDYVFADWRPKKAELDRAGKEIGWDLVELAEILESGKMPNPEGKTADRLYHKAALYLRARSQRMQYPADAMNPEGREAIVAAIDNGDVEFFKQLGKALTRDNQKDIQIDRLKFFLHLFWSPFRLGISIWPGFAYMTEPVQIEVTRRTGEFHPNQLESKEDFRMVRRRLGLKRASPGNLIITDAEQVAAIEYATSVLGGWSHSGPKDVHS